MTLTRRRFAQFSLISAAVTAARGIGTDGAWAQEGLGPFMPQNGSMLTTAWTNAYGPDAESWIKFSNVAPDSFDIDYSSSRGMKAKRHIPVADRQTGRTMVLGYNSQMPVVIPGTTTLGTSTAVLEQLRSTGSAAMGLISDTSLNVMPGQLTKVEQLKLTINVIDQQVPVPVMHAQGQWSGNGKTAQGDLYFLDNRNNPILLRYSISFTGEPQARTENIVLVTPGPEMASAMEQALSTMQEYTTRGIHFDFDKATIQSSSSALLDEIAKTLNSNPLWTLMITGHTDSIGDAAYNQKLSQKRADSVKAALVMRSIAGTRLATAGAGASQPVATNKTLEGRALNRRVVLKRTDR